MGGFKARHPPLRQISGLEVNLHRKQKSAHTSTVSWFKIYCWVVPSLRSWGTQFEGPRCSAPDRLSPTCYGLFQVLFGLSIKTKLKENFFFFFNWMNGWAVFISYDKDDLTPQLMQCRFWIKTKKGSGTLRCRVGTFLMLLSSLLVSPQAHWQADEGNRNLRKEKMLDQTYLSG